MPVDHAKLRKLIIARYGSIAAAARALGRSQPNLSNLVNGRSADLRISDVDRWAKLLGCRSHDLVE